MILLCNLVSWQAPTLDWQDLSCLPWVLAEVKREMRVGEELFAFLDNVCILSSPARTRFLHNLEKNCSPCRGSSFTQGRQGAGIAWDSSTRFGGVGRVEPRRDQGSRNAVGLNGIRVIYSAFGKSCCNVPVFGATTLCERCFVSVLCLMRKVTTKVCQEPWAPCWVPFREQKDSTRLRRCLQFCPCGWAGWVCVQFNEWSTQLSGLLGLTQCPSPSEL